MILRELSIGDRFIHARDKGKRKVEKFIVCSKPEFNREAGTATRKCVSESGGGTINKQCILKVIKLNSDQNAPVSDTTDDDSSNGAKPQKEQQIRR